MCVANKRLQRISELAGSMGY